MPQVMAALHHKQSSKPQAKRATPNLKLPVGILATPGAQVILPQVDKRAETIEARISREIKARHTAAFILGQLFAWLKANVGVDNAWRDFEEWTELAKPKSIKERRGPSDYHVDIRLLREYDLRADIAPKKRDALPRLIAEEFHKEWQGKFGASSEAIAKRIRRLLEKRETRRAIDTEIGAALQELMLKMGWSAPEVSNSERRRKASKKSKDK